LLELDQVEVEEALVARFGDQLHFLHAALERHEHAVAQHDHARIERRNALTRQRGRVPEHRHKRVRLVHARDRLRRSAWHCAQELLQIGEPGHLGRRIRTEHVANLVPAIALTQRGSRWMRRGVR
jgi:hypothetical protein